MKIEKQSVDGLTRETWTFNIYSPVVVVLECYERETRKTKRAKTWTRTDVFSSYTWMKCAPIVDAPKLTDEEVRAAVVSAIEVRWPTKEGT